MTVQESASSVNYENEIKCMIMKKRATFIGWTFKVEIIGLLFKLQVKFKDESEGIFPTGESKEKAFVASLSHPNLVGHPTPWNSSSQLYVFGDVKSPTADSISLVEELTRSQVVQMVMKAAEVAHLRSGTCIIVEDILFLLRKNLDKLKLLWQHLQHLQKSKAARSLSEENSVALAEPGQKKTKYSLDFLSPREQAIVDNEEKSAIMLQRLETMDRVTSEMDASEYMHYATCRQVNFYKNSSKFVAWLDLDSLTDLQMKQDAVDAVALLTQETVREITELALQVKEDMEEIYLRPPHSSNPRQYLTPATLHQDLTLATPSSVASQDKERQRLGSSSSRINGTSPGERMISPLRLKRKTKALQPHHIREAFRRYSYSQGPSIPLSLSLVAYLLLPHGPGQHLPPYLSSLEFATSYPFVPV